MQQPTCDLGNTDTMPDMEKDAFTVEPASSLNHHETVTGPEQHKEVLGATRETLVIDDALSKRVVRKYDYRILPLFLLINLFSFIDRVNIGNARLLGLQAELELGVGLRWNIALMCLFVSYCVVELPSNIACKKLGGHIWIPFLIFVFAVLTICTSVVENRQGLYAVRFLLGCAEGGISPGLVWMLSQLSVYPTSTLRQLTKIVTGARSWVSGLASISRQRAPAEPSGGYSPLD